jgi:hypothetical protein
MVENLPHHPKVEGSSPAATFSSSGLYYKSIRIINDDSSIVNKLETSLIDDARVVIYDRCMFILQITGRRK